MLNMQRFISIVLFDPGIRRGFLVVGRRVSLVLLLLALLNVEQQILQVTLPPSLLLSTSKLRSTW